jgi:Tol biopolymer transport system component
LWKIDEGISRDLVIKRDRGETFLVVSPDGKYILIAMWVHPCPRARRSLYIVSRDGAEVRWLTHFGHHHSWTPGGGSILFNDSVPVGTQGDREPRMCLVDFDGTNRRIAFDQAIGSHPLMHPDGTRIVDADRDGVYVVRLDTERVERLADFTRRFEGSHHGTHPHPVWNKEGSAVLYNSAERGHSEVYLVTVNT